MKIEISIPTPLRSYVENQKKIQVDGSTVSNALENLVQTYTKLDKHLFEDGKLRNFVNIYLNDEDIRYLDKKLDTELEDGDKIAIIPSIAGGKSQ